MTKLGTPEATAGPGSASKKVGLVAAGDPSGLRSFSLILSSFFLTSSCGLALGALSRAFFFALSFVPETVCLPPSSEAFGAWSVVVGVPEPPPLPESGLVLGLVGLGAGEVGVGAGTGSGSGLVGVGVGIWTWSSGVPGGTSTVTWVVDPSASWTVTVRSSALAGVAGRLKPTSVAAVRAALSSTKRGLLLIRAELLLPEPLRERPGPRPSYQNVHISRAHIQVPSAGP